MDDNKDLNIEEKLKKSENKGCVLGLIGIITLVIGVILAIVGFNDITAKIGIAAFIIALVTLFLYFYISDDVNFVKSELDKKKNEVLKNEEERKVNLVNELQENISMPKEAIKVWCNKGLKHIEDDMEKRELSCKYGYYVMFWKEQNNLYYTYGYNGNYKYSDWEKFNGEMPVFKISDKDFLFYAREGEFYIKTDVSGGGTDYGRAIVGGLLFGPAGAIVASRNKTKTSTMEIDKRTTILYYKYNDELADAHFDKKTYNLFKSLFPSKDSSVVDRLSKLASKNVEQISSEKIEEDVYTKIEKLGNLKDKGYITKEEFNIKKKQLLE